MPVVVCSTVKPAMVRFLFPFRLVVSSSLPSSVNVNGDTAAFTEEEGDSMVYLGASLFPVRESSGDDNNNNY